MTIDKPAPAKRAKQKRNRIITACYDCRERKAGCDRKKPICTRCQDGSGRTCIYLDPPNNALINGESRGVQSLPLDIKDKVLNLYNQCLGDTKHEDEAPEDFEGLEPSPLVQDSATYDNDADTEAYDTGFRVGVVQLTGRIGGQYRPVMVQELKDLLEETSHQPEWAEEQALWPTPPSVFETGMVTPNASFMKPGPNYYAPNVSLITVEDLDVNLLEYLPSYTISSRLLEHYWKAVHPIARILHRPSFEARWQIFADHLANNTRPPKPLQALIFAVLFSATTTLPRGTLYSEFGEDQEMWTSNLKTGLELALSHARMFSSTNIETLQAFVAYLMVICGGEVSRSHATLVASAIRVAELNGLHVDPQSRGYNPIQTHVRRLIWFSLGCLDIRVTEAQGPRPSIHTADYTTHFPANVNDSDLTADGKHPAGKDGIWTEMTVPLIRYRCNEFMRTMWTARTQLLAKEQTLAPVVRKIESFRLEWSLKFAPSDPNDPIQLFGIRIMEILMCRCAVMILHPFHKHPKLIIPDRLVSILTDNALRATERSIEIETFEEFAQWRWFDGAIQQHQSALWMSVELLINPRRKEAARMWRSLNYVFSPPQLPPIARARWVITQFWLRMEYYLSTRSLRPPIALEKMLQQALNMSDGQKAVFSKRHSVGESHSPTVDGATHSPSTAANGRRKGSHHPVTAAGKSRVLHDAVVANNISTPSPPRSEFANTVSPSSASDGSHHSDNQAFSSNTNVAPQNNGPKQVLDIDWSMLDTFYSPDQFSGDLDVPYDRWTQLLQSVPFPTGTTQDNVAVESMSGAYMPTPATGGVGSIFGSAVPPHPTAATAAAGSLRQPTSSSVSITANANHHTPTPNASAATPVSLSVSTPVSAAANMTSGPIPHNSASVSVPPQAQAHGQPQANPLLPTPAPPPPTSTHLPQPPASAPPLQSYQQQQQAQQQQRVYHAPPQGTMPWAGMISTPDTLLPQQKSPTATVTSTTAPKTDENGNVNFGMGIFQVPPRMG